MVALSAPIQGQRGGQPVQLPEGNGKALVSTTCTACHGLNLLGRSVGYTQEEWTHVFSSMVALPQDQSNLIAAYLAEHFPEKPDTPKAVVVDGPVSVNIREWLAPTLGQRPHDPLAARDGSIWWSGQYDSRLGRVDPTTGVMKEYPLDTPDSGPHGLVEDGDGNIWYTGINVMEIGKLDPSTGTVTEYKITVPGTRGPHTPIFDQKGTLFFTLQSGHVGRLDPSTGEITVAKTPTDGTYPYGIQVNSQGVPWYVDFRGEQGRQRRSRDDGDHGIHAAESGGASPTHRPHSRRRRVVHGLCQGLSGPIRTRRPARFANGPRPVEKTPGPMGSRLWAT